MRVALSVVIMLHGLIHLMGFAKAFRLAELRDLTLGVSRGAGLLWLACGLAFVAGGVLLLARQEAWWWPTAPAIVLSQALILGAWRDGRFGTLANLVILVPVALAAIDALPNSYARRYEAAAREGVARCPAVLPIVTEADVAELPPPVQRYLRYAGAIGRPRIQNFRAAFVGEFRNGTKGRWMSMRAQQYDFWDDATRVFLMNASMLGLPATGLHLFRGEHARMQIKTGSLVEVVDAQGPQMDQGETVTVFNDLCALAPACLIDRNAIQWEALDALRVRAKYTRRGITISAELLFDEAGRLVDFVSNDRFMSADGKTYESYPWSTPLREYRDFGGRRVASEAEAVWRMPSGDFSYGRFRLTEIEYNLREAKP